jgi:probable LLM family oxidoreductase
MQLGIYSFGDTARDADGRVATTAQATRNLFEAIELADQVGLDYFGIGEHHTRWAPASSAATILAGAATRTSRIRLGSSVTVLGTDDPVRVFQQFATVDALSSGRAEITAGRGSSTESFPLFGYALGDHDTLFADKLGLLMQLNHEERITWQGSTRPALDDAEVVPRPEQPALPVWLGTGGNPGSSVRAARLGLPIAYGIISGALGRFAPLVGLYREAFAQNPHPYAHPSVAVGSLGFVAPTMRDAHETWYAAWSTAMRIAGATRGFPPPRRAQFDADAFAPGGLLVGSPESVAERLLDVHGALDHDRHYFQMDIGQLAQRDFLRAIELLGTEVKPILDRELGAVPEVVPVLGAPRERVHA